MPSVQEIIDHTENIQNFIKVNDNCYKGAKAPLFLACEFYLYRSDTYIPMDPSVTAT